MRKWENYQLRYIFQFNLKFSELNYKQFMEDSYENLNFHVEM